MSLIPLEVESLVDDFNLGPLTVERRDPPIQNAYGGFDAVAPVVFALDPVAAHNVQGRDLDQVPEADRNSEIVQFYARVSSWPVGVDPGFRVADGGKAPDVVTYRGRRFRIIKVRDFFLQGDVHCALGALEDLQAVP